MSEPEIEHPSRELIELLNEIRVALPGVQVLFAFLLALPFQTHFTAVTGFQRNVYFVTLSCSFVATALLITPSALHRINFRKTNKRRFLVIATWLTVAGIAVLAPAMIGVMLLIGDVLFGRTTSVVSAVLSSVVLGTLWVALPIAERRRTARERRDQQRI
jgi:hypothetical protein